VKKSLGSPPKMRNILSFSVLPSPFFTSPWSLSPLFLPGITLEGQKGGKVTKGVYNNNKKMARENSISFFVLFEKK
jgi:hypothetical protein